MGSNIELISSRCTECGRCADECDFLIAYGKTPKELAEEASSTLFSADPALPYSCNTCGRCATKCPEELDVGRMFMEVRAEMVRKGTGPLRAHRPAVDGQEFYLSDQFWTVSGGSGGGSCDRLFFPGCSLSSYSPEIVSKAYAYLSSKLGGLGIGLGCCGGPSELIGKTDRARAVAARLEGELERLGVREIIVVCPFCYALLSKRLPKVKVSSIYPVLDRIYDGRPGGKGTYALHDPCKARHRPEIQDAVRSLIAKAGFEVEELAHNRADTQCCGMGGMASLVNPRLCALRSRRTTEATEKDLVTYCVSCRTIFSQGGKRTLHVLDLLFADGPEKKAAPSRPPTAMGNLKAVHRWARELSRT